MPADILLRKNPHVCWSGSRAFLRALVPYCAKQIVAVPEVPEKVAVEFSEEHLANSNILIIDFLDVRHFAASDLLFLKTVLQKMKREFPDSASFWNLERSDIFHSSIDSFMMKVDEAAQYPEQELKY